MSGLTRRKFLIGALAVAAVAVVGAAVAPKAELPARPILTINKMPAFVRETVWNTAQIEYITLKPKAPYILYQKDLTNITPLN